MRARVPSELPRDRVPSRDRDSEMSERRRTKKIYINVRLDFQEIYDSGGTEWRRKKKNLNQSVPRLLGKSAIR